MKRFGLRKLKDPIVLYELYLKSLTEEGMKVRDSVYEELMNRICNGDMDEKLLFTIAKNYGHMDIRETAASFITDQSLILLILHNPKFPKPVQDVAFHNLEEQDTVLFYAFEGETPAIRREAISKIKDQKLLAKLAKYGENELARVTLNQHILLGTIYDHSVTNRPIDRLISETAASCLTDRELLIDVAENAKNITAGKVAKEKLDIIDKELVDSSQERSEG